MRLIIKRFSKKDRLGEDTAYNGMVGAGKAGLVVAGGLAGAGAVELGRAASYAPGLVKDAKEVINLRNNKQVRSAVKSEIHNITKKIPVPGLEKSVVGKIKNAENVYNNTKFSKLDRIQRGFNILNKASEQSRTVLGNSGRWASMARETIEKRNPELAKNKEVAKVLDKGVNAVGNLGKAALKFKNAKILGKSALAVGGIAGATYLHGKELQNYKAVLNNSRKDK